MKSNLQKKKKNRGQFNPPPISTPPTRRPPAITTRRPLPTRRPPAGPTNRPEAQVPSASISSLDINSVEDEDFLSPFDNPPFISADGKEPRVKANINNRFKQVNIFPYVIIQEF